MFQVLSNIENVYQNYFNESSEIIENIEFKVATDENFRPVIPQKFLNKEKYSNFIELMKKCWSFKPDSRPSFLEAKNILSNSLKKYKKNKNIKKKNEELKIN